MQIMRVVLGETCTRFPAGRDGGRDGWFRGEAVGRLLSQDKLSGAFVVQCKHTSHPHHALESNDMKKEVEKVTRLAASVPCHYVLMTNRQVTALAEEKIRATFEAIAGVNRCLILSETWIEDTANAEPRLLRLVPRLYGIGDLTQILSFTIEKQTIAILEDLVRPLKTFVPTDSYRRAETALHEHRFVVLVGPPASGKSAISANLCMVNIAQNPAVRIMRIEEADQFKSTWSPEDKDTIYWVDDVFGETTLDDIRLKDWSAALEKIEAARKRGARIIFCTRDYILAAAQKKLKRAKADIIDDARVKVNVTELSAVERESILYNHIKEGDISKKRKGELKPHLANLATLNSFSPELARRLGSGRFSNGINIEIKSLRSFFDQPIDHFCDVLHGLAPGEIAALTICLLNNNAVPNPVPESAAPDKILQEYGVSLPQVRESFDLLEGSLVKKVLIGTSQIWQVHHPSMIEALHRELSSTSAQMIVYLQAAKLEAILRDTTTIPTSDSSRLVFLPSSVYPHLVARLVSLTSYADGERFGKYLVERASDDLLRTLVNDHEALIVKTLSISTEPTESDISPRVAIRLSRVRPTSLLSADWQQFTVNTVSESFKKNGWLGFIEIDGFDAIAPGFVKHILQTQLDNEFASFEKLYDWFAQDISSRELIQSAFDGLDSHATVLKDSLTRASLLTDEAAKSIIENKKYYDDMLKEHLDEKGREEDKQADMRQDDWRGRWQEDRYEAENGRFADVDE